VLVLVLVLASLDGVASNEIEQTEASTEMPLIIMEANLQKIAKIAQLAEEHLATLKHDGASSHAVARATKIAKGSRAAVDSLRKAIGQLKIVQASASPAVEVQTLADAKAIKDAIMDTADTSGIKTKDAEAKSDEA